MKRIPKKRPLTNIEISEFLSSHKGFRGVYCIDRLPKKPRHQESGIVNLSLHSQPGTHWCAYKINGNIAIWFDSYGLLRPPKQFINYCKRRMIFYNHESFQSGNSTNCGQLCIKFIKSKKLKGLYDILT